MQKENKTTNELPAEVSTKKKKTPKWLKALEAQSWQAELLISGLVIAGLLQLPDEILMWTTNQVIQSSEMGHFFYFCVAALATSSVYVLIITFSIHFLTRAIWIALLGLNSVYPDGIQIIPYMSFSEAIMRRMKKEFPDLGTYNQELDAFASLLFSFGAIVFMMNMSIAIIIFCLFIIAKVFIFFIPINLNKAITIGVIIFNIIVLGGALLFEFIGKTNFGQSEK